MPRGKAAAAPRTKEPAVHIEGSASFLRTNKLAPAIRHGAQLLAVVGPPRGRPAACYISATPGLKQVRAVYKDAEVVADENLITSRLPAGRRPSLGCSEQLTAGRLINPRQG
jgi:putative intracellular protease/amidase